MYRRMPVRTESRLGQAGHASARLFAGLVLAAAAACALAQTLPKEVAALHADLRERGSGEFRFFGFHIYDARLWSAGSRFDPAGRFALGLRYARDFAGERIAKQSDEEIARLGIGTEELRARWLEAMKKLFPDVKAGTELIGVNEPGRGARFFRDGVAIGSIDDPEFAGAFFAIWLDPRTRAGDLRRRLLGTE